MTNDQLTAVSAELEWEVTAVDGDHIAGAIKTIEIGPNQNSLVDTLDLQPVLSEYGGRNLLVWFKLNVKGKTVSTNLALFSRPKHLELHPPEIEWQLTTGDDGRSQITLTAQQPALWVWIEIEGERVDLSDNFFHLYPGQAHTVTLLTDGEVEESAVRVYSLFDTFQES